MSHNVPRRIRASGLDNIGTESNVEEIRHNHVSDIRGTYGSSSARSIVSTLRTIRIGRPPKYARKSPSGAK